VAKLTTTMAVTVTIALLSSLFVALTIVPLFSSIFTVVGAARWSIEMP